MKKNNKQYLSLLDIRTITNLFIEKKWEIDEVNKNSLFNRFKNRYSALDNEIAKNTFIRLASDYRVFELEEYHNMLLNLLKMIFVDQEQKAVLVFPLLPEEYNNQIKSSSFMCYLFNHVSMNYYDVLSKKKFRVIETLDKLKSLKLKGKYLLLVDDYIGSGKQSMKAFDEVISMISDKENCELEDIEKVYILSLVINEKGFKYITDKISIYENVSLKYYEKTRSISVEHHDLLKQIGIIDHDKSYLGYEDCADLVTLVRTPNNTIPLFRKNKSAPFQRRSK